MINSRGSTVSAVASRAAPRAARSTMDDYIPEGDDDEYESYSNDDRDILEQYGYGRLESSNPLKREEVVAATQRRYENNVRCSHGHDGTCT